MTAGVVVRAAEIGARDAGPGASLRTLIDTGAGALGAGPAGAAGLVRYLADLEPGGWLEGAVAGAGELWFVLGGAGQLEPAGHPAIALRADRGILLPPGAAYRLSAGGEALRVDIVTLPGPGDGPGHGPARGQAAVTDFTDCAVETTGDRQFRVLFGPGHGCTSATQFVGEIPPGRAPEHSHPYDEVVLILAGHGVAHIGGTGHELAPGTCAHLPPGLPHCLENTGRDTLRVLGVFHPADSPAAKLAGSG
ncbi:MAG: cupin domain-containing protein [Streptosporangiaceae bacterium]